MNWLPNRSPRIGGQGSFCVTGETLEWKPTALQWKANTKTGKTGTQQQEPCPAPARAERLDEVLGLGPVSSALCYSQAAVPRGTQQESIGPPTEKVPLLKNV